MPLKLSHSVLARLVLMGSCVALGARKNMKLMLRYPTGITRYSLVALAAAACPSVALAAPCSELITGTAIYGSGGSAVTPTLKNVAVALQDLPAKDRVTI